MAIPPVGGSSLAGLVADRLWETQLRKEHQALLGQIRDIGAQRDSDLANLSRKWEDGRQLHVTLQSQVNELERRVNDLIRVTEQQDENITEYMAQVKQHMGSWVSAERLEEILSTPAARDSSAAAGLPSSASQDEPKSSIEDVSDNTRARPPPRVANRKPSKSVNPSVIEESSGRSSTDGQLLQESAVPLVQASAMANTRKRPPRTHPTNAEPPRAPPTTRARGRSRSRSELGDQPQPPLSKPPIPKPASTKIPKLAQNRRPFKVYYDSASEIFKGLGSEGKQMGAEFISTFIKGIRTPKAKDKLKSCLEQSHITKTQPDGTYVALCSWDDVGLAMRRAGLDIEQPVGGKSKVVENIAASTVNPTASKEVAGLRAAAMSPPTNSSRDGRSLRHKLENPGLAGSCAVEKVHLSENTNIDRGRAALVSATERRSPAKVATPQKLSMGLSKTIDLKSTTQGARKGGPRATRRREFF